MNPDPDPGVESNADLDPKHWLFHQPMQPLPTFHILACRVVGGGGGKEEEGLFFPGRKYSLGLLNPEEPHSTSFTVGKNLINSTAVRDIFLWFVPSQTDLPDPTEHYRARFLFFFCIHIIIRILMFIIGLTEAETAVSLQKRKTFFNSLGFLLHQSLRISGGSDTTDAELVVSPTALTVMQSLRQR